MDFNGFVELLKRLDKEYGTTKYGMFLCHPRDHGNGLFSYQFDGYLPCCIKVLPDGRVLDWQDVDYSECTRDNASEYDSVDVFVKTIIDLLEPGMD